jgi:hypothetical protein
MQTRLGGTCQRSPGLWYVPPTPRRARSVRSPQPGLRLATAAPNPCQGAREVLRRHVDECDVTPDCLGYRPCNLCVRNCRRPGNCVCLAKVSRLSQHGRSNKGNVTNIDGADACVADRGEEPSLMDNRRLECHEALEVEIGPEERIADSKLADPSLDCCVVPKESYRRRFTGCELRQLDEMLDACRRRKLREPHLLGLGIDGGRRHEVRAFDPV